MKSNQPIYEGHPPKCTSMILPWEATFVDGYLLSRSTKEQKVIRNMTCPSIIFHTSEWGRNFLKKIGHVFLYYVVALSSCNTRFEEEKWELSQLGYSGEMQLLQKDFDMAKNICGCWLGKQNIHRIQENIPVINADPRCTISENFNYKTYLSYTYTNHKYSGSQEKTYLDVL